MNTPESPAPAAPQEKEVPVSEALKAAPPETTRTPGETPTAPVVQTPSQAAASKDEALLKALAEEKRLEVEKRKFLAGQYTSNGEKAYQGLKFDEAKEWALRALDQDAAHQPALDLLLKSRSALGERECSHETYAASIVMVALRACQTFSFVGVRGRPGTLWVPPPQFLFLAGVGHECGRHRPETKVLGGTASLQTSRRGAGRRHRRFDSKLQL